LLCFLAKTVAAQHEHGEVKAKRKHCKVIFLEDFNFFSEVHISNLQPPNAGSQIFRRFLEENDFEKLFWADQGAKHIPGETLESEIPRGNEAQIARRNFQARASQT